MSQPDSPIESNRLLSVSEILLRVAAIIAAVEFAIMLTLDRFAPTLDSHIAAFVDMLTLVAVASPLIYLLVVRPFVRARDAAIDRISYIACHDALTSLPNRRLLHDTIDQKLAESARHQEAAAILFIDLDGFKGVNDTHGHPAGDFLLQEVAHRLRQNARREDAVSRVGGDEFVVMIARLPAIDEEATAAAHATARKILAAVSEPYRFGEIDLAIGASIGIRIMRAEGGSAEALLRDADHAMYEAKADRSRKVWIHGVTGAGPLAAD
jgi:diguanylate cyclase (GGDEF)-like protein